MLSSLAATCARSLARPTLVAATTPATLRPCLRASGSHIRRRYTTPSAAKPADAALPAELSAPVTVTVFKVPECMLCEEAKHICEVVAKKAAATEPKVAVNISEVDIHDPKTKGQFLKYMMNVPVIHLNDRLWGMHRVDPGKLLADVQREATASSAHPQQSPSPYAASPIVPPEAEAKQTTS